jgi:hypothetical protein
LSPTEALAVIAAGRDAGVDRLVVTHAQFEVVNMSVAQMKEAAGWAPSSSYAPWARCSVPRRIWNGCVIGAA